MANSGGTKPWVTVTVGNLIDFGDELEPGGNVDTSTQSAAPKPSEAVAEDAPRTISRSSDGLIGAIQQTLKDLSMSKSGSSLGGTSGAPQIAGTEQHTNKPSSNNGTTQVRSRSPRSKRPRELTKRQLMEKLVETKYMPSLKPPTTRPTPVRKHQNSYALPLQTAPPTLIGRSNPNHRVYISPEELEREGIKRSVPKPRTELETKNNKETVASLRTSSAPHLHLHTQNIAASTLPSGSSAAVSPGPHVLSATAAAAAVVVVAVAAKLPTPTNNRQTPTTRKTKKLTPYKGSSQDMRSQADRAMPAAPLDKTPTSRQTTYASVVARSIQNSSRPVKSKSTRGKKNTVSRKTKPAGGPTPRPSASRRQRPAHTAWPQPATTTSSCNTAAAIPGQKVQPEPTAGSRSPVPDLLITLSPSPILSPTLSTAETVCPSPPPLDNIAPLEQEAPGDPGDVGEPSTACERIITCQPGGSPIVGPSVPSSRPACLEAPEDCDTSLLLTKFNFEGVQATPRPPHLLPDLLPDLLSDLLPDLLPDLLSDLFLDLIPSKAANTSHQCTTKASPALLTDLIELTLDSAADAPFQCTRLSSASLEDLQGLDFS